MRSHKMTTRSMSTAQHQQPPSDKGQPQKPRRSSRKKFPQFTNFPSELRSMVWDEFLDDYEDNPPVAWTLIWGIDDPANHADPTNIRLRPYIMIDRHCQNDRLVEYNSNPLLKVNHEARTAALRNQRYVSIRVWKLDINIVIRPAMDYFYVDKFECDDIFESLLPELAAKYGNPTAFTLAEDMSFVKQAFALEDDWFNVYEDQNHFNIAKNALTASCIWCALEKLSNNCLSTAKTLVTRFKNEDEEDPWGDQLDFYIRVFNGSRVWPAWAFYSYYYQSAMLFAENEAHGPGDYLCVNIWSKICRKLLRCSGLKEELHYAGTWDHIGNPWFGPKDFAGPEGSHLHLYAIYDYVRNSVKLAKTRRVTPRRPVRMLRHGRTLPEISSSFLRHQPLYEAVELQTTCGAQCNTIHRFPKKNDTTRSNANGFEGGDNEQDSDAWRYREFMEVGESTSDQDTSGEDTNDEGTNNEDHNVDDDQDHAEPSEENNDGYESLEL
ncbi:hypothetical protein B0T20DRAFT_387822 [Sordaria brevicollis]|uniref:2EXR domain-containing protein n=1 Tax=Sordaria brevicollis TaxID=83679 RepID=A0AAE0U0E7_SORBR|nr:hypothetical protein B0T20DRAFT_387822 [Sordaria brevicollis]